MDITQSSKRHYNLLEISRAPVAQGIEQGFPKPCVGGSNPSRRAILLPAKALEKQRAPPPLSIFTTAYSTVRRRKMSKRRGKGEGSIYRRKDGLWVGQYELQTPTGTKTKYLYGKSRKEVAANLAKAIAERNSSLYFDSDSMTLREYLDQWLDAVKDRVRHGTWRRYEEATRLHINPSLGKLRLNRLSAIQIQSLYRIKLESGLSPRTVQIIHSTLRQALKQAMKWSLIPRNVTEAVDPPRSPKREINPFNKEQARTLLEAARETKLYALYLLAITTGMRQGELLGLKWEDLDLQAGTLQVRRTVFNGKVNAPKSSKGKRSIRLTSAAVQALQVHQRQGDWVFSSTVGTPISCHNLINRSWRPLLRKAGIPYTNFHTMRHTAATLLLTKGVHPKIVQEMLGHSTISITLDTYSHVLPNLQKEAVKAMEDLIE
jgi:integrase